MALLRNYIDVTPVASLASNANSAYGHNLAATPHAVFIRRSGTAATNHSHIRVVMGAVSNTVYNAGAAASGTFDAVSVLFHSMIQ